MHSKRVAACYGHAMHSSLVVGSRLVLMPEDGGVEGTAPATIELKLTALKVGAGNGPPPTVSKSETVGQMNNVPKTPVAATGVYAGALGTITVPGAANPTSGRDIVIEQTVVPGRVAPAKFCSQLGGRVVAPTDFPATCSVN